MIRASLALFLLCLVAACQLHTRSLETFPQGSGGVNASHQLDKSYLVLISIDAFRWDYTSLYPTPHLDRIIAAGSKAERLVPVFPTLTFPNHYSIATGLYPANHGIVANTFPDPENNRWYSMKDRDAVEDASFYGGEPVWVTAETQGMVAASFFFVGSEAPIKGVQPTHWRRYDGDIPGDERVDQVLAWLAEPAERRPHMITLYFEAVDSYAHWYGPDSEETVAAIARVDGHIGRLLDGLEKLPHGEEVNIIVVSDHGQRGYLADAPPFVLADYVYTGHAPLVGGGSYLFIHLADEELHTAGEITATVNRHWEHGTAYTRETAPPDWHVTDNPRFPDVILAPEPGYAVIPVAGGKPHAGDHGWAPEAGNMHGIFMAAGPNIRPGVPVGAVEMVDVYPLMLSILGLDSPGNIDGDAEALAGILRTGPSSMED
ncbi:MAG: ectonucleotide pyrophosphatase/phosphodiesterase [Lysobacterales bacterium]|jgi:predicted AlkP superfamily pyrophosphatase or phosphodiesterase